MGRTCIKCKQLLVGPNVFVFVCLFCFCFCIFVCLFVFTIMAWIRMPITYMMYFINPLYQNAKWLSGSGRGRIKKNKFSIENNIKECLINSLLLGFSDFQNIKIMNYGLQAQEIHPNSTMSTTESDVIFNVPGPLAFATFSPFDFDSWFYLKK